MDVENALAPVAGQKIPATWKVYPIGQALTLINGRAFKPSEWSSHGIPIIRIQNLNDDLSPYNYCNTTVDQKYHVHAGDVLFAWSGTTGTSFGARIWRGPDAVLNQHIYKVISDPAKVMPYYSYLVLQKVQEEIEKHAHGFKSSFVHVKKSDLEKVPLPIPPISEQQAIAEAVSDVDQLIASLEALIAKKQAIKQGMMQALLTGQIRLSGFREPWQRVRIEEILAPRSERNTEGLKLDVLTCTKRRGFVRSLDYFKNQVFSRDLIGYRVIYRGDIGYPANHIEEGSIGVQEITDRGLVSPIYVVMRAKNGVDTYFLQRQLKLETFRQEFSRVTNASVNRRGSLRWKEFSQISVLMPELIEQQAISTALREAEADIEVLSRRLEKTRAIKQGMIQELLTGRMRLPVGRAVA
jgi:type I restriction enzyme S subunit